MKLSYRGISYEREQPPAVSQEGEIISKYRGQEWKYYYPRHVTQLQPKIDRKYRGIPYGSSCSISDSAASLIGKFCTLPAKKADRTGLVQRNEIL